MSVPQISPREGLKMECSETKRWLTGAAITAIVGIILLAVVFNVQPQSSTLMYIKPYVGILSYPIALIGLGLTIQQGCKLLDLKTKLGDLD